MSSYTLITGAVEQEVRLLTSALASARFLGLAGERLGQGLLHGRRVLVAACGLGTVNAAHTITACLERYQVERVIMVGCAGAYPQGGLEVGDLVMADQEVYGDLGVLTAEGCLDLEQAGLALLPGQTGGSRFSLDCLQPHDWLKVAERVMGGAGQAARGSLLTVDLVSGDQASASARYTRFEVLAENMEGAAGAHVCSLYGVPFSEVRGISNMAGDRHKERWDLEKAARLSQEAVILSLRENLW